MKKISKKKLAENREALIKNHRQKKGFVCASKTPNDNWYSNWDEIFKKETSK